MMWAADIRAALAVLRVEHVALGLLAFALGFHNATVQHIRIPNLSAATRRSGELFRGGLAFELMSKLPLSYRMCT
jgi:hypothetical protein